MNDSPLEMSKFSPVPPTPLDDIFRQLFPRATDGSIPDFQFVNSLVLKYNFSGSCNSGEEDIVRYSGKRPTHTPRDRERMVTYLRGPFLLATAIAFLAGALMSKEVEAGSLSRENGMGWAAAWSACGGTIGECLGGEEAEEMAMDSESNRRILQGTGGYIIYKPGLSANQALCRNPGAPYSNCRPSAVLNPFPGTGCKGPLCYRKPA